MIKALICELINEFDNTIPDQIKESKYFFGVPAEERVLSK